MKEMDRRAEEIAASLMRGEKRLSQLEKRRRREREGRRTLTETGDATSQRINASTK